MFKAMTKGSRAPSQLKMSLLSVKAGVPPLPCGRIFDGIISSDLAVEAECCGAQVTEVDINPLTIHDRGGAGLAILAVHTRGGVTEKIGVFQSSLPFSALRQALSDRPSPFSMALVR